MSKAPNGAKGSPLLSTPFQGSPARLCMFPGAMPQAFTLCRVAAKPFRHASRGDGTKTLTLPDSMCRMFEPRIDTNEHECQAFHSCRFVFIRGSRSGNLASIGGHLSAACPRIRPKKSSSHSEPGLNHGRIETGVSELAGCDRRATSREGTPFSRRHASCASGRDTPLSHPTKTLLQKLNVV